MTTSGIELATITYIMKQNYICLFQTEIYYRLPMTSRKSNKYHV